LTVGLFAIIQVMAHGQAWVAGVFIAGWSVIVGLWVRRASRDFRRRNRLVDL
jgi:hypothetical protein